MNRKEEWINPRRIIVSREQMLDFKMNREITVDISDSIEGWSLVGKSSEVRKGDLILISKAGSPEPLDNGAEWARKKDEWYPRITEVCRILPDNKIVLKQVMCIRKIDLEWYGYMSSNAKIRNEMYIRFDKEIMKRLIENNTEFYVEKGNVTIMHNLYKDDYGNMYYRINILTLCCKYGFGRNHVTEIYSGRGYKTLAYSCDNPYIGVISNIWC